MKKSHRSNVDFFCKNKAIQVYGCLLVRLTTSTVQYNKHTTISCYLYCTHVEICKKLTVMMYLYNTSILYYLVLFNVLLWSLIFCIMSDNYNFTRPPSQGKPRLKWLCCRRTRRTGVRAIQWKCFVLAKKKGAPLPHNFLKKEYRYNWKFKLL